MLLVAIFAVIVARRAGPGPVRFWALAALLAVVGQYLLGVVTLLYGVPIPLGAAHQGGALILLISITLWRAHNNG